MFAALPVHTLIVCVLGQTSGAKIYRPFGHILIVHETGGDCPPEAALVLRTPCVRRRQRSSRARLAAVAPRRNSMGNKLVDAKINKEGMV